jgi:DNA replication protein DnaC
MPCEEGADWLARLVGPTAMEMARAADGSRSAVLVGPPGSGKTSLAVAMFRAVIERAADEQVHLLSHRATSAHALAKARAFHPLGEGEAPAVLAALEADLLLLDELGGEDSRYASAVTEVIYERHAQMRPTWITTGVDPKSVANRYGGGIARRVFEDATLLQLGGRK